MDELRYNLVCMDCYSSGNKEELWILPDGELGMFDRKIYIVLPFLVIT